MKIRTWFTKYFPLLIFALGVLPGLMLGAYLVWADVEATLFDASMVTDAKLNTLRCPLLMTAADGETAVSASFTNPSLENPSRVVVRARISAGFVTLISQNEAIEQLQPLESRTFSWPLTAADVVYGRFILVRVSNVRNAQIPGQTASCGVVFLDIPIIKGWHVVVLSLVSSLLLMGSGAYLWIRRRPPADPATKHALRGMGITASLVVSAWVTGILGWWILGILVFAATLLWAIALMDPISRG